MCVSRVVPRGFSIDPQKCFQGLYMCHKKTPIFPSLPPFLLYREKGKGNIRKDPSCMYESKAGVFMEYGIYEERLLIYPLLKITCFEDNFLNILLIN